MRALQGVEALRAEEGRPAVKLTTVQRMILTFVLDEEQRGKPAIIATGHKKTRVGYFPSLQAEGIATNTTSLFFLRNHGFVEQVHSGRMVEATLLGDAGVSHVGTEPVRYRLTDRGRQALRKAPK